MSPSRKKPKSQAEIELSHATVCRAIQKGPCPIQGQRQSVRKYPWPILQNLTSITVYKSTYLHTYTQLTLVIPVVPGYNTLLKNSCLKEADMRSSVIVSRERRSSAGKLGKNRHRIGRLGVELPCPRKKWNLGPEVT